MPTPATAFPCCRAHDLVVPIEEYPVAVQRTPGDEVYWFDWNSSFSGNATIRVSKLGGEAIVVREYRPSPYGRLRRFRGLLTPADWSARSRSAHLGALLAGQRAGLTGAHSFGRQPSPVTLSLGEGRLD